MIKDDLLEKALDTINSTLRKKINKARNLKLSEASKIIKKLKYRGWSTIKIAYNINVSEQTIRMWEHSKSVPHSSNFYSLKILLKEEGEDAYKI